MMLESHFPSLFSNYFKILLCGRPEFDNQVGWASPSSFGLWARWMAFGPFLFMFCLPWITGVVGLWGPWWITEMLDLVHRGQKKMASTFSPPNLNHT
jgi:hypothetical protein